MGWIFTYTALDGIFQLNPSLVNAHFRGSDTYLICTNATPTLPTGWNQTKVVSVRDETQIAALVATVPGCQGIVLDLENWVDTPANQKTDKPTLTATHSAAWTYCQAHSLKCIIAPGVDLTPAMDPTHTSAFYPRWNNVGMPTALAPFCNAIDLQSQGSQATLSQFTDFVVQGAAQSRAAKSGVEVIAGLSTTPAGGTADVQQLLDCANSVSSTVTGFWMNVPGSSTTGNFGLANQFLAEFFGTSGGSPASITVEVDPDLARVFVTVFGAPGSTGTINRVDSAGNAVAIRGADPAIWQGGGFSGDDFEAPLDEPVSYQVLDSAGALQAASPQVIVPSTGRTWLKNPGRPDMNVQLNVVEFPELDYDIPQGVFKVIGSQFPVVVSSQRWAATGTLTAYTGTLQQRGALINLLADGAVLLLQTPGDYGVGSVYVAVGQVAETRVVHRGAAAGRTWALPLTVVEKPIGLASASVGNAWADVLTTYGTWTAVMAVKASWTALIERVAD